MRIITVLFYSMIGLSNSDSLQCFSRISPQAKEDHASNNATCSVHLNYSHPASSTASSYDRSSSRSAGFCSSFKDASGELKSCDVDGICQEPGSRLMCHNGVLGTLHCCSADFCNSDAKVELLNNESFVMCLSSSGEPISCSHSGCMNTTTYNSSGSIWLQEFGCADNRVCATNDSSLNQCSEFNTSSGKKRQCHCTTNYCNELMTSATAHSAFSTVSLIRANQVDRRSDELRRGWIFVGTSFGIVILFLIVFTLVIFIVKKYRDRRDRHLTYTYTQLTADLAEEREADDEYMLIA